MSSRKGKYIAPDGGEGIPQEQVLVLYNEYRAAGTSRYRKEAIRNQLVTAYQNLIKKVAREFTRTGHYSLDDVAQEATLWLLLHFGNYDPERGMFSTFVAVEAKHAALYYTARFQNVVNWPGSKQAKKAMYALIRLMTKGHRLLTTKDVAQVAQEVGLPPWKVDAVLALLLGSRSLHSPLPGQEDLLLEDILCAEGDTPEDIVALQQVEELTRRMLQEALDVLSHRERSIVQRRLLADGNKVSLQELGDEQGVSAERIRQLEIRAKCKMREVLAPTAVLVM